jgi:hypothetical protein
MEDLKKLARAWRRADTALVEARRALSVALLEATEAGTPQRELVELTGINRETIRLMCQRAREERAQRGSAQTSSG